MKVLKQYPLTVFLCLHFLVWSLIPLLRTSLPMDSIEAIVWGQYCDWGTNKHPPLSGFLAYWAYTFGAHSHLAIYALSQLCVLCGFVYIYKLAKCFMAQEKAVLAVMLLEGVIYYGYSAPEFNVNVVSLALWPATVYYFYKALKNNKMADWVLTGVFAGLNLFNKYVSGVLLLSMLFYMFYDRNARQKFKTVGPYLSALFCMLVVLPHVWWLYLHDFYVIDYFLGRGGKAGFEDFPLLRHIVYPIKFLGAQVLFGLGALLIYFIGTYKAPQEDNRLAASDKKFLLVNGLLPLALMVLVSLAGGIKLKSMWGFPALYMTGILLLAFFPRQLTDAVRARLIKGVYIIMSLMGVALICVYIFNKSDKLHMNAPAYGAKMEEIWRQATGGRPFKYVAGDVWWADNLALFAPSKPKPVIWGDISKNPWFDAADLAKSGALITAAGEWEYRSAAEALGNATPPQKLELEFVNPAGKIKRKTIYYGFYNL